MFTVVAIESSFDLGPNETRASFDAQDPSGLVVTNANDDWSIDCEIPLLQLVSRLEPGALWLDLDQEPTLDLVGHPWEYRSQTAQINMAAQAISPLAIGALDWRIRRNKPSAFGTYDRSGPLRLDPWATDW